MVFLRNNLSVFIYKLICAASADSVVNVFLSLVQIIFYLFTIPCVKIIKYSFPKVELDIGVNNHKKMRKYYCKIRKNVV